jgi:hypothetical protein
MQNYFIKGINYVAATLQDALTMSYYDTKN